eukprot:1134489-Pelagomonas_calceolata.AAC.9
MSPFPDLPPTPLPMPYPAPMSQYIGSTLPTSALMPPFSPLTSLQATSRPRSSEEDIDFILATLSDFLDVRVSRGDVLSTWCGIRPLPAPKKNTTSENVVRDHGE